MKLSFFVVFFALFVVASCRFHPEVRAEIQQDLNRLEKDIASYKDDASSTSDEASSNGQFGDAEGVEEEGDDDASLSFDDSKCTALRGTCKNPATSSCSDWRRGNCGGGSDRLCCVPSSTPSNPSTPSTPSGSRGEAPLIWTPSASSLAIFARNPPVTYTAGGPWNGGRNCAGGIKPWPTAVKRRLLAMFPGIVTSIGGYNCRQNTANTAVMSEHGSGRALDIMITPFSWNSKRADIRGDAIANWLLENGSSLGVQYFIWNRYQCNFARRSCSEYCRGGNCGKKSPHIDHIHCEFSLASANRSE